MLLRGGSKDVLNEIERNLQDAIQVVRNIVFESKLLPGGGATEMAVGQALARCVLIGKRVDLPMIYYHPLLDQKRVTIYYPIDRGLGSAGRRERG